MKLNQMDPKAMPVLPPGLSETLARHDTAIEHLGSQMRTLQGEVHQGFAGISVTLSNLSSKFDKLDAQPKLNLHQAVQTLLAISILFTMVVGGIMYVTSGQFATVLAKQEMTNDHVARNIDELGKRVGWHPDVQPAKK